MKMFKTLAALAALSLLTANGALAKPKADIKVMTQNQYLGADLTPIVSAENPADFNDAVIAALLSIAANNFPERANALAESIADKSPHLVGLQEVYEFECVDFGSGLCSTFHGAFNDHLAVTLDALAGHGANYVVVAEVQNLTLPAVGFPFPGLPVFLNDDLVPDIFIKVTDRDVILARADVVTQAVPYACDRPSLDGCNFNTFATADTLAGPIIIERGFVGVDARIDGQDYRFVNTHLEVQFPAPLALAPMIQAGQATELLLTLAFQPAAPGSRLIVVGDINSSPTDPVFDGPFDFPIQPPYQQLANGTTLFGDPLGFFLTDIWGLRPGKPDGFTCCELPDLSNPVSQHGERIDVIFTLPAPISVKANVLDAKTRDKTRSGHWPSDHASVSAELAY
jgi:endonuclease/exonuclease/phosphatase family metal-dependent hydrolase